jgi:hypothetical protein
VASPTVAGSPVGMRCCSPTAAAACAVETDAGRICSCSSEQPASAADAVAAELQALRVSRANYQSAVLQQQAVRNSLLGSLGDALEVRPSTRCACKEFHVQGSMFMAEETCTWLVCSFVEGRGSAMHRVLMHRCRAHLR